MTTKSKIITSVSAAISGMLVGIAYLVGNYDGRREFATEISEKWEERFGGNAEQSND